MDISVLEDIGLTNSEAKIYLALLELGETKVGKIIKKSGVASSVVHNSINNLVEKGLVSYVRRGKIKFYQAVSPKQILSLIEERKNNFLKVLPELDSRQKKSEEKQEAEIFKGIKGVTSMLNILIEDVRKGDDYLFFSVDIEEKNKEIQDFFWKYDVKRKDKGLIVKGLAPKQLKHLFEKRRFVKMRYTNFPILSNVSLCNDKIALFSWVDKPVGYLIKSKEITKIYRDFFNRVWKLAKPRVKEN